MDTGKSHSNAGLIASGASACLSGDSAFFFLERKLTKPIPVLLASRKPLLFLTRIGSLRIPMPSSKIRIKQVYHKLLFPQVILSLGILLSHGLHLVFDKDCSMLFVHKHHIFKTTISNNCLLAPTHYTSNPPFPLFESLLSVYLPSQRRHHSFNEESARNGIN